MNSYMYVTHMASNAPYKAFLHPAFRLKIHLKIATNTEVELQYLPFIKNLVSPIKTLQALLPMASLLLGICYKIQSFWALLL